MKEFKELNKISIEGFEEVFYVAQELAILWGHSNVAQSVGRILDKEDYIYISKKTHSVVFDKLVKNNILSNKTRKSILIKEEGVLALALKSNTKKSKEFVREITKEIIKTRKDFGLEEIDFIGTFHNSYYQSIINLKTYIMYDENSNLYKIGVSKNPKQRESTLSSQIPKIKIILFLDRNIEKLLHKLFENKRVRGEWFKLDSDDIISLVCDYGFVKYINAGFEITE
jgi:prophage antirepressor-like protein